MVRLFSTSMPRMYLAHISTCTCSRRTLQDTHTYLIFPVSFHLLQACGNEQFYLLLIRSSIFQTNESVLTSISKFLSGRKHYYKLEAYVSPSSKASSNLSWTESHHIVARIMEQSPRLESGVAATYISHYGATKEWT